MIDLAATMALVELSTHPPSADAAALHHMAQQLLDAGADPNHHEALYHACEHTNHGVLEAILGSPKLEPPWLSYCLLRMLDFDDLEGVEKMLRAGADPNLRSRQGDREMSLHRAIRRGRDSATIELLLAHGARPDIINIHNHTARRQAIRFGRADFGETACYIHFPHIIPIPLTCFLLFPISHPIPLYVYIYLLSTSYFSYAFYFSIPRKSNYHSN